MLRVYKILLGPLLILQGRRVRKTVLRPLRWYLGQCAHRLDQALRAWVGTQRSAAFVSLPWATMVASSAVQLLRARA